MNSGVAKLPKSSYPLVVGSIPTRPTKNFKGLASAGPLVFSGSPQVGIVGIPTRAHPRTVPPVLGTAEDKAG